VNQFARIRCVDRSRRSFARAFGHMEGFGGKLERALSGFFVKGFFLVRNTGKRAELIGDAEAGQVEMELAIDGQQFVVGADYDLDFCVLKFGRILLEELEGVVCGEAGFVAECFLKNFGLFFGEGFGIGKDRAIADG